MNYTYDPTKIALGGKDQVRFELGDVGPEYAISDDEIAAIIAVYTDLLSAKLKIAESIYRRFTYEVDHTAGGVSLQLGQRAERWKKIYEDLRKRRAMTRAPELNTESTTDALDEGHYFKTGFTDTDQQTSYTEDI